MICSPTFRSCRKMSILSSLLFKYYNKFLTLSSHRISCGQSEFGEKKEINFSLAIYLKVVTLISWHGMDNDQIQWFQVNSSLDITNKLRDIDKHEMRTFFMFVQWIWELMQSNNNDNKKEKRLTEHVMCVNVWYENKWVH